MQPAVLPDLAHTHTRPVHWLATAAAMAAVVAGAHLLRPDAATASSTPPAVAAASAAVPAPDPAAVTFPLECRGAPSVVASKASGDLDGDGRPETVAVVHCDAGSGAPPHGVYVLTHGRQSPARVVATLIEPGDRKNVTGLAVRDRAVTATLLGYSSPDVPSCCPDRRERVKWQWKGGKFIRTTQAEARSV
ncbi:hypothetical protein [Streptomyces purpureus]|uniref:Secreted protein n=1 Tax=Streptomyces purpureus TaxID=1951 RepID=A0A918H951_9ACTN|nr:hypothetical protein [Streptomyces purpureus]GGT45552.1 hypothetical protein GCM10014713_44330 [Streptomyces purpureus]